MFLKKKILALVPARGGSKGIKYKNLKKINGKSLIGHVSQFIDHCGFFDDKILSTESNKIEKEAVKFNFQIFKRSKYTSKDFTSDFEVIIEVVKKLKLQNKFDYIVYLQPTSPIRKKSHLKKTLKHLIKNKLDSSFSISPVDKKFHPLKIIKIKNSFIKYFDKNGKKIVARQQLDNIFIRNGVFYIFKITSLKKQKTIFLRKNYASVTKYKISNIDNLSDLKTAKKLLNYKKIKNF